MCFGIKKKKKKQSLMTKNLLRRGPVSQLKKTLWNLGNLGNSAKLQKKNTAYGRHQLSRQMRIVEPVQILKGCVIHLREYKYIFFQQ